MAGTRTTTTQPAPTLGATRPPSFLTSPITIVAILLRLFLILLPEATIIGSSASWLYSPSLLSVLVRPFQTLGHLREANAIQTLASSSSICSSSSSCWGGAYLANGSIRIPPLLLVTLSPFLDDTAHPEFWLAVLLFLVDLVIAYLLEQIGINVLILSKNSRRIQQEEARQRLLPNIIQPDYAHIFPIYNESDTSTTTTITKKNLLPMSTIPRFAALLYFGSPSTILPSSLYGCWQNLPTLLVLASIYEASCGTGYYAFSSCLLAVATYLEPYSAVYAIPAILLFRCSERRRKGGAAAIETSSIRFVAMLFTIFFLGWSLMLQGMTLSLVGSTKLYWTAVTSVFGSTYLTTSPNLSMQWYFSMQLFARFRDYFGTMFLGLPFVLMGPLTVRLWKYPEVLIGSFALLWCIYRPVQVLYDANVGLCLLLLSPRSLARMGVPALISLCSMMVPVLLNVVDYWMWLEANNGNANYMFFQCLAYNVFLGIIVGQFVSASVQRDKALRMDLEEYNTNLKQEEQTAKEGTSEGDKHKVE